jgi:ABC-type multidrug transport system ATPase subunit
MEIRAEHLTRRFGKKEAVSDLSFSLPVGVYGLLGDNGAGKSTLMRILAAIDRQSEGAVTCDGRDILKMDEDYRGLVGYMPQDFNVYPSFTAAEFVRYIGALKGLSKKELNEKVRESLRFVNLEDAADKKVKTFSGGMKRRVGIAQAMIGEPAILILDEPTAGLDPNERIRFSNILSEMGSDRVILFSTHIISDIEAITDNVILLQEGRIREMGKVKDLLTAINGKVFEEEMSAAELPAFRRKAAIVRIRQEKSGISVRYLGEKRPASRPCDATLEDYYISLNGGELLSRGESLSGGPLDSGGLLSGGRPSGGGGPLNGGAHE